MTDSRIMGTPFSARIADAPSARRASLGFAEHRLLERLGDGEADLLARRNLDRFAGLRIASHARLHLAEPEDAEPRDLHGLALLHALHDGVDEVVQQLVDLLAT